MPIETVPSVWQMWPSFAAALVMMGCYVWGRFPIPAVGFLSIAGFVFFFELFKVQDASGTRVFDSGDLLAGMANPALITIMSLLVLGQGLFQTRALDFVADRVLDLAGKGTRRTLALFLGSVFALSAFVNDTPVVVMFLPIMTVLAQRLDLPASRVMMSLSFVAILGGMSTLMGTSTNILVAQAAEQSGHSIAFFDPLPMGLLLGVIGIVYLAVLAPVLLPTRTGISQEIIEEGKQFLAQLALNRDHPLVGAQPIAGTFTQLPDLSVRMVLRGEHAYFPPFEDITLEAGDILIVAATRKSLTNLFSEQPEFLNGILEATQVDFDLGERRIRNLSMSEVVVAPASRMIGRTIEQIGFRHLTGCIPLGIQRRSRMIGSAMSTIRLEAGDVLLVLGPPKSIRELRTNRDVLLLDWQTSELPLRVNANTARLIFGLVVATAATGLLPMVVASLSGAALMLMTRCLNFRQAIGSIDINVFFLVASSLALATALQGTGGAHFLAENILGLFAGASPWILVSALFLLVAITTNLLTNNATAVLFTPIALELGRALGGLEVPFAFAVMFGANMSFASPIGYQTNLLVMSPGHYRFIDFARLGLPLVLLLWVAFTLAAPVLYPELRG